MGQFSFMYADTDNREALRVCGEAYVICPDGSVIHEDCYGGYGIFCGKDIYELVADWNRKYLAKHPEFPIFQHYLVPTENGFKEAEPIPIDQYDWYRFYADLSLSREEVVERAKLLEYRLIGIDIACYDDCNANLPCPIKICKDEPRKDYGAYPPSKDDPNQGWRKQEESEEEDSED